MYEYKLNSRRGPKDDQSFPSLVLRSDKEFLSDIRTLSETTSDYPNDFIRNYPTNFPAQTSPYFRPKTINLNIFESQYSRWYFN